MLIVSSLADALDAYARFKPSRVISLLSDEEGEAVPEFPGLPPERHLTLCVDCESSASSINVAARARAAKIIDFAKDSGGGCNMLIHCNRGVSRSTAAAFIVLCMREPETPERALLARIRAAAPHADPCPLLINYADEFLGRDGRMIDAVDDLSPPSAAIPAPLATVKVAA